MPPVFCPARRNPPQKHGIPGTFYYIYTTLTARNMDVKIAPDWKELLAPEFEKPYFAQLTEFVRQEYASRRIFPRGSNIFRAFDKCPFEPPESGRHRPGPLPRSRTGQRALLLGRRTAFPSRPRSKTSSRRSPTTPARPYRPTGNLDRWAEQGVLLLNAVLTVRAHEAASHAGRGWETFTDAVVRAIAQRKAGHRLHALGQLRPAERRHRRSRSAT